MLFLFRNGCGDQMTEGGTLCLGWKFLFERWEHLNRNPNQPLWRDGKEQAHGVDEEAELLIQFQGEGSPQAAERHFVHQRDDFLRWFGRGRGPSWLNELVEEGYTLDELRRGQTIN